MQCENASLSHLAFYFCVLTELHNTSLNKSSVIGSLLQPIKRNGIVMQDSFSNLLFPIIKRFSILFFDSNDISNAILFCLVSGRHFSLFLCLFGLLCHIFRRMSLHYPDHYISVLTWFRRPHYIARMFGCHFCWQPRLLIINSHLFSIYFTILSNNSFWFFFWVCHQYRAISVSYVIDIISADNKSW